MAGEQTEDEALQLFLSGGGHRATIGAFGAVAYLLHADRWKDVEEVVSVSGGSMANAVLAQAPEDDDGAWRVLADTLERIDHDKGGVWATTKRRALMIGFGVGFAVLIALLVIAAGVGPDLPRGLSLLLGLLLIPIGIRGGGKLASELSRDFIVEICNGENAALRANTNAIRRHTFCASGLTSATPYLLWTGKPVATGKEPSWGAMLQSPYKVIDAALASVSLTFMGTIRTPREPSQPELLAGGEILVDGGVSGIFGEQVLATFRRTPADTDRSDEPRIVAVDAGRHVKSAGPLTRRLARFSTTATLFQWLVASLEATYVNDLVDLAPTYLARVCEPDDIILPAKPDGVEAAALSPMLALRLGAVSEGTVDHDLTERLGRLRALVAEISLVNLDEAKITAATTAGFVATMRAMQPFVTNAQVVDALADTEARLGLEKRLTTLWAALA